MLRLSVCLCMIVQVCTFMPIVMHCNMNLGTTLRCLPQNASLYSDLVPISTKMSGTQIEVIIALMQQSPPRPLFNDTLDYWRRLWVEFRNESFSDQI